MARAKTPEPRKMTHTHLLALAFKGIDAEIGYWEEKQQTTDNPEALALLGEQLRPLREDRALLEQLYIIETGHEY